jgi:hypothetical protein
LSQQQRFVDKDGGKINTPMYCACNKEQYINNNTIASNCATVLIMCFFWTSTAPQRRTEGDVRLTTFFVRKRSLRGTDSFPFELQIVIVKHAAEIAMLFFYTPFLFQKNCQPS